jgi:hypothetical protein
VEIYLRPAITMPIDDLYPDPHNPRLALEDPPSYEDADALFDEEVRKSIFGELGDQAYGVDDLVQAIVGQGWMPIDNILIWIHPDVPGKGVIVEGNRRRLALEKIRVEHLPAARRKLERVKSRGKSTAKHQIQEMEERVRRLERVVADTEELRVLPVNADTVEELGRKLPRVLAVRHITGAREWGNFAEDLWLLNRYFHLFADKHGDDKGPFWDNDVIGNIADEASLGTTKAKWQLKASSWFSHFKNEYEDQLPAGEEFGKTDYYLFELISRKPWVRTQLDIGEDAFELPAEAEQVLFEWVFKEPRGKTADQNPNVFYRHENVVLWDQMRRYDDAHGTSFAAAFNTEEASEAPTMREIEAQWLTHKAQRKPHAVLDDLLRRLKELTAEQLAAEGQAFRAQLEQLEKQAGKFLKMIDAAES